MTSRPWIVVTVDREKTSKQLKAALVNEQGNPASTDSAVP
jgi:hypothetical protein